MATFHKPSKGLEQSEYDLLISSPLMVALRVKCCPGTNLKVSFRSSGTSNVKMEQFKVVL
jgi:hypothetical protein